MIRIDNVMVENYDLKLMKNDQIKLSANLCKTLGAGPGDTVIVTADENNRYYIAKSDEGRTITKNRVIMSKSAHAFLSRESTTYHLNNEKVEQDGVVYYGISPEVNSSSSLQQSQYQVEFEERSVL